MSVKRSAQPAMVMGEGDIVGMDLLEIRERTRESAGFRCLFSDTRVPYAHEFRVRRISVIAEKPES
jgi:hypothetical protein